MDVLSGAIGGLIIFILVVIREWISQKKRFLGILRAEMEQNKEFLQSNRAKGKKLYFREDGWLAFRNQGGFRFIPSKLYSLLVKHYTILYELNGLVKNSRESEGQNLEEEIKEYEERFADGLKCLQIEIEKETHNWVWEKFKALIKKATRFMER